MISPLLTCGGPPHLRNGAIMALNAAERHKNTNCYFGNRYLSWVLTMRFSDHEISFDDMGQSETASNLLKNIKVDVVTVKLNMDG